MALEDAKSQIDLAITAGSFKGLAFENAFSGVPSFLRRKLSKDLSGVDLAITGIPFDQAVTHRAGTRFGPRAIRAASSLQPFDPPFGWDGFSPLEEFAIADYGDMALDYAQPAQTPAAIEAHIAGILAQGANVISLGGDHSITLPILRAHVAKFGPVALLQFDAHTDTWPDDAPARVDHGTFCYKAVKEGLIDVQRSIHVGIRTVVDDNLGIEIISAQDVARRGVADVVSAIRTRLGDAPVYLSFDIDALDPSHAPGTGTPVWGGLSSREVALILRGLAGINLIGGDVVEVSPPYDTGEITAVVAAHVALELICLWGWPKRGHG